MDHVGTALVRYFDFDELAPPQSSSKTVFCNCKQTRCLKKYCDCFAQGKLCANECRCRDCENHENSVVLMRYKCDALEAGILAETKLKCNCRNSRCLKKYCVCFAAKSECTKECKCRGCNNHDTFLPMLAEQDAKSAIGYLSESPCPDDSDDDASSLRLVFRKRPPPNLLLFPKKKKPAPVD